MPYQTNGICMSHYYCLAGNNVLTNRVQRRITVFVQFIYLLGMKFNHIVNSANTNWRRYCNVQKNCAFSTEGMELSEWRQGGGHKKRHHLSVLYNVTLPGL